MGDNDTGRPISSLWYPPAAILAVAACFGLALLPDGNLNVHGGGMLILLALLVVSAVGALFEIFLVAGALRQMAQAPEKRTVGNWAAVASGVGTIVLVAVIARVLFEKG